MSIHNKNYEKLQAFLKKKKKVNADNAQPNKKAIKRHSDKPQADK